MNISESSASQLFHLDILSGILPYLPPESIIALANTSRRLLELIRSSSCWRQFCIEYNGRHCRSSERNIRIRLEAFDESPDASWWRLWRFLKRHEALMGFWALDARCYGRLLAIRLSPTTGKITCEALVQSVCSDASMADYMCLRDTYDEFNAPRVPTVLARHGGGQREAVFLPSRHLGGIIGKR